MAISRRQLLFLGTAVALGAAAAGLLIPPLRRRAHDAIAKAFGAEIAAHGETAAFLDAYVQRANQGAGRVELLRRAMLTLVNDSAADQEDEAVVSSFAISTNVVRASELGEDLVFVALYDPYDSLCSNQLNSANAP